MYVFDICVSKICSGKQLNGCFIYQWGFYYYIVAGSISHISCMIRNLLII